MTQSSANFDIINHLYDKTSNYLQKGKLNYIEPIMISHSKVTEKSSENDHVEEQARYTSRQSQQGAHNQNADLGSYSQMMKSQQEDESAINQKEISMAAYNANF